MHIEDFGALYGAMLRVLINNRDQIANQYDILFYVEDASAPTLLPKLKVYDGKLVEDE